MYAGRVAWCPVGSHDEYADGTDRQTDARPTNYTYRYRSSQRKRGCGGIGIAMEWIQ